MKRQTHSGQILSMVLSALLCLSCSREKVETTPTLRPVRYEQVYATGGMRERAFSGVAQAGVEAQMSFRVAGTLQEVAVKIGDKVSAGSLIAQLDPTDYRLQVEEAEAALEQARAQSRNAAATYDRVRALYENKNASRNDLDAARASDESARAAVESTTKRLEMARSQLGYTKLTAPVEGAIADVTAEVNENVKAGETIALLTSGSRMEVGVTIPEVLISDLREGDPVTVAFDAIPDRRFDGRVREVGVASTGMVTTFPVTVVLNSDDPSVRPGMAAQVSFRFASSDPRERFIVPSVAVGEDREGRFLFVVEPSDPGVGVVHRRQVTIGELLDRGLEVFEGLHDGDLVLTAGIHKVADGMRVRLPEPGGSQS